MEQVYFWGFTESRNLNITFKLNSRIVAPDKWRVKIDFLHYKSSAEWFTSRKLSAYFTCIVSKRPCSLKEIIFK